MKYKTIEPIEYDENGELIINACCTAANADWIRAARLAKKADDGDKEAKKILEELHNTKMVRIEKD